MRSGAGYLCQFHPNHQRKQDYSFKEIDVFAAYVIPENVWYLIPAVAARQAQKVDRHALPPHDAEEEGLLLLGRLSGELGVADLE
jgi:hypothetical protein